MIIVFQKIDSKLFIIKWRIFDIMKTKNKHSPNVFSCLRHKNLLDFGAKKSKLKFLSKNQNDCKLSKNRNEVWNFVKLTYNYGKICLNQYSNKYSKQLYSQPALFTIVLLKIYLNLSYRGIMDYIDSNRRIKDYLKIKKSPDYSTLQRFFKRMPTDMFERITEIIIDELNIEVEIVALDGSGFSQDTADQYYMRISLNNENIYKQTQTTADQYYMRIRDIKAKKYTKCHISIDVGSRLILHSQALNGARHDLTFANAALRKIKKYKPKFILADKAYDSEKVRAIIHEELNAQEHIPIKGKCKKRILQEKKPKNISKRNIQPTKPCGKCIQCNET